MSLGVALAIIFSVVVIVGVPVAAVIGGEILALYVDAWRERRYGRNTNKEGNRT